MQMLWFQEMPLEYIKTATLRPVSMVEAWSIFPPSRVTKSNRTPAKEGTEKTLMKRIFQTATKSAKELCIVRLRMVMSFL